MITDFLKTKRSKEDLKIALDILEEFKACENADEWLQIPFMAWIKLEQLQEFLEHLVNGEPLAKDTKQYIKMMEENEKTKTL